MSTLFQNIAQAQQYAAFRPTYPPAVYRRIIQALGKTKQKGREGLGVDVGCGSGQATLGLAHVAAAADTNATTTTTTTNTAASASGNANIKSSTSQPILERIIGIDPSPAQVQQARHKLETSDATACSRPTVEFHPGHDTEIVKVIEGLLHHAHHPHNNPVVTCITAAQAAHWFDLPMFYQQVDQLLVPGGVLALWTYGNLRLSISEKVDSTDNSTSVATLVQELEHKIMVELYENILGDTYWDPRRRYAETLYRELPQIQSVLSSGCSSTYTTEYITNSNDTNDSNNPEFSIRQMMTRAQLMGYLRSWSGYISYLQHNQISLGSTADPVAEIDTWIANRQCASTTGTATALPDTFQVEWPIAMLLSIKQ